MEMLLRGGLELVGRIRSGSGVKGFTGVCVRGGDTGGGIGEAVW